jgi:hypothetical protein
MGLLSAAAASTAYGYGLFISTRFSPHAMVSSSTAGISHDSSGRRICQKTLARLHLASRNSGSTNSHAPSLSDIHIQPSFFCHSHSGRFERCIKLGDRVCIFSRRFQDASTAHDMGGSSQTEDLEFCVQLRRINGRGGKTGKWVRCTYSILPFHGGSQYTR